MVIIYKKGSLTLQQKVYSRGTSNKPLFIWEFRGSMELGLKSGISAGFGISNRQYSYSPTVLGQVGLDDECEAHAGNFSPRGQTNMRKLRVSLPNLRKIFNIVKFLRA